MTSTCTDTATSLRSRGPIRRLGRQRSPRRGVPPAHALGDPDCPARHCALSYPSRRYRSALIEITVHSAQKVVVLTLPLSLVLQ
jgi:hypothetical protein